MVCLQGAEVTGMDANRIKLGTCCISVVAILFMEIIAALGIAKVGYPPLLILGVVRIIAVVMIIVIVVSLERDISAIGLAPSDAPAGFTRGLVWSAGFAVVAAAGYAGLFLLGIDACRMIRVTMPARTQDLVLLLLVGGVVGPVAEEVFFRGVLYGFFRRWGVVVALIASSALFVLAHMFSPGVPWIRIAGGVIFALAYEIEGTLVVPITIHVLGNLAIFTLSLIH
jgi:membrane protease YdiL (CAAX protease family)